MKGDTAGSRGTVSPGIRQRRVKGTLGLGEGACGSRLGEGPGHWPSISKHLPDSMFINKLAREVGRGRDEERRPAPGGS